MFLLEVGKELLIGVFGALVGTLVWEHLIEPRIESRRQRKELERIAWLFPISKEKEKPEVLFKCSLKPPLDFKFAEQETELFAEFFGKNPPTYRKYVHSAEVLALQRVTEWLSSRGVRLVPDAFYGGAERPANLLLIGSAANLEMSKFIEQRIKKAIIWPVVENAHRYFQYGDVVFDCDHTPTPSPDGLKRVTRDSGVIARITSSDGTVVLLLAGIHMHGTLAAAEVALNPAFQERVLKERRANFAQLVRVNVLANGTSIDRTSLEWKDLPFLSLD